MLALAFVVGFLGIFSEGDEGGVLGYFFFAALVVNFLWILATSIVMLRARPAGRPSEVPSPPG